MQRKPGELLELKFRFRFRHLSGLNRMPLGCPHSLLLCCCDKILAKSNLGGEGLLGSYILTVPHLGTSVQELKQEQKRER